VRVLTPESNPGQAMSSFLRMPDCPFCHVSGKCDKCCGAGWIGENRCDGCRTTGRCLACAGTGRWPTSEAAETPAIAALTPRPWRPRPVNRA
jgi:hypothetical protein